MALVYNKLHQSNDMARINLKSYLTDLVSDLAHSYDVNPGCCRYLTEVDDVLVSLDIAIPCGLIVNEVISNSLKYAFPDTRQGTISVTIKRTGKKLDLVLSDD
jgi:two-component sensor histidine kinase